MQCADVSFKTAGENILFDECLLKLAESGRSGEMLRFWEFARPFIVLGKIGKVDDDVIRERAVQDGIKVYRRFSGGGTVLQGKGCLNYTLILSKKKHPVLNDLKKSYGFILGMIVETLKDLNIRAAYFPISDIALIDSKKKFSGNAQKRARQYICQHGTLLYNFDLSLINRYLQMPKDIPEYRAGRDHKNFVTNINIDPAGFKVLLMRRFGLKDARTANNEEMDCLKEVSARKDINVPLN